MAYHLERGGVPLHETVGVNGKKWATIDTKAQEPSIWSTTLRCVCWMIVHNLAWHNYQSLMEREGPGLLFQAYQNYIHHKNV